jgi:hypothetical protein
MVARPRGAIKRFGEHFRRKVSPFRRSHSLVLANILGVFLGTGNKRRSITLNRLEGTRLFSRRSRGHAAAGVEFCDPHERSGFMYVLRQFAVVGLTLMALIAAQQAVFAIMLSH